MIVVVATFRAREGREQELRTTLEGLVPVTREERGSIQYDLHVAEEDPASLLFYERWESDEALQEHLSSPHVGAVFAIVGELCVDAPRIDRYSLVG